MSERSDDHYKFACVISYNMWLLCQVELYKELKQKKIRVYKYLSYTFLIIHSLPPSASPDDAHDILYYLFDFCSSG